MFRVAALVLTVFLVLFTYLFSNATYEQQQRMPAPIREAATEGLIVISEVVGFANDSIGVRLRRGFRRASSQLFSSAGNDGAARDDALIAMSEDLTGHDFTAQFMPNATFTRAKLDGANFTKTFMDYAALDSASLTAGIFDQTILTDSSARGADFSRASFDDADLTGTMAQGAVFNGANFNVTLLSSSQFSGAEFRSVNMLGSYGDKSIFYAADFSGANISGSDFAGATLDKAMFHGAILFETHLGLASLLGTDFSGADLSRAIGLTQEQLDYACGDDETQLPDGLTVISCAELAALNAAVFPESEYPREPQSDHAISY